MPSRCINKRLVFIGLAEIRNIKNAPKWRDIGKFAPLRCARLVFLNLYGNDALASFGERVDDLVTMNTAPGGNVAFHSRVGAGHSEQVTVGKGLDLVLRTNDRHRAEQSASINLVFRHASSPELL
jgi:hypothetical protein